MANDTINQASMAKVRALQQAAAMGAASGSTGAMAASMFAPTQRRQVSGAGGLGTGYAGQGGIAVPAIGPSGFNPFGAQRKPMGGLADLVSAGLLPPSVAQSAALGSSVPPQIAMGGGYGGKGGDSVVQSAPGWQIPFRPPGQTG